MSATPSTSKKASNSQPTIPASIPVATVLVRGNITTTRIITLIVIAPLAVSVVVRAYGWQLILGNGPTGLLNYVLMNLGIIGSPLTLLFSDAAVIIGSLHIFFPMMVLPLSSALGKIDPNLQQAARTLGAPAWKVFLRITFPLSLPGLWQLRPDAPQTPLYVENSCAFFLVLRTGNSRITNFRRDSIGPKPLTRPVFYLLAMRA